MRRLLFILTLFVASAQAQIVSIPDINFKNRLIYLGIDTNSDGDIQYSEAEAVTAELNLNYGLINDLTGISSFTNMQYLWCDNNSLTSITVSNLPNLKAIDCGGNP